jgi:hypothetical protein
LKCLLLFIQ